MKYTLYCFLLLLTANIHAQIDKDLLNDIEAIENKIIDWRHYFHQNPELSNREFNTAKKNEEHHQGLGVEVQTGVAKTGVVGWLKGKSSKYRLLKCEIKHGGCS